MSARVSQQHHLSPFTRQANNHSSTVEQSAVEMSAGVSHTEITPLDTSDRDQNQTQRAYTSSARDVEALHGTEDCLPGQPLAGAGGSNAASDSHYGTAVSESSGTGGSNAASDSHYGTAVSDSSGGEGPLVNIPDLLDEIGNSVYVLAVRCFSEGRLMMSASITLATSAALQLILMFLVLYAVLHKDELATNLTPSEQDFTQMQLKALQLQVCSIITALQNSSIGNFSAPAAQACGMLLLGVINSSTNNAATIEQQPLPWLKDIIVNATKSTSITMYGIPGEVVAFTPAGQSQRVVVLIVSTLSLLILALLVVSEALEACEIAYVTLVYAGRLVPSWLRPHHVTMATQLVHKQLQAKRLCLILALLAPALQLTIAVLVYAVGLLLMINMSFTTDSVSIIINSVALAFILEIDNMFGAMFARQLLQSGKNFATSVQQQSRQEDGTRDDMQSDVLLTPTAPYMLVLPVFYLISVALLCLVVISPALVMCSGNLLAGQGGNTSLYWASFLISWNLLVVVLQIVQYHPIQLSQRRKMYTIVFVVSFGPLINWSVPIYVRIQYLEDVSRSFVWVSFIIMTLTGWLITGGTWVIVNDTRLRKRIWATLCKVIPFVIDLALRISYCIKGCCRL